MTQFVRENWPALLLMTFCLLVIFALLVDQTIQAAQERKGRILRALRRWLGSI